MCGIGGYIDFSQRQTELVGREMLRSLTARGPDEEGLFLEDEICLVHRRLAVIDLENGKQPMETDGNFIIVYNGELYNTEDIRSQLRLEGCTFRGHSDTEVLLAAYVRWGAACLEKLNGIYAFAIWDKREKTLFLARDRMGVKPLFYAVKNGTFVFASDLKTLLCHPAVEPEIDQEGLYQILLLGPAKIPGSGVFRNVHEIKQGQYGVFSRDGFRETAYFSFQAAEHTDNLEQTIEKTRYLIEDAAVRQLVSDMPLACFLSGGLDSSILSAVAAKQYRAEGNTLTTFSVDYEENDRFFQKSLFQPNSDSEFIQTMTEAIGSRHRTITLNNYRLADALREAVLARDLPGMADVDASLLLFCREIKREFTVCVSGECADEIFGGYPWYHNPEILHCDTFPWSRSLDLRKSLFREDVTAGGEEFVRAQYEATLKETDKLPGESQRDSRMREMFMLNIRWFMQTLLDRKDRMSMYSGLEVRVPFCDHRIAQYAYNMPWEFKAYQGREKGIVRQAFADLLPEEIVWRKKSPYPKTFHPVYTELTRGYVRKLLKKQSSPLYELLNVDAVVEMLEQPDAPRDPWFGQLMRTPQIFAYLHQLDVWFRAYGVRLV